MHCLVYSAAQAFAALEIQGMMLVLPKNAWLQYWDAYTGSAQQSHHHIYLGCTLVLQSPTWETCNWPKTHLTSHNIYVSQPVLNSHVFFQFVSCVMAKFLTFVTSAGCEKQILLSTLCFKAAQPAVHWFPLEYRQPNICGLKEAGGRPMT